VVSAAALTGHVLLNAEYTNVITTAKVQGPPGMEYVYGFMEGKTASGMRWFGHNGGAPGVGAFVQIFPDSGQVLVILANRGERIEGRVASVIDGLFSSQAQEIACGNSPSSQESASRVRSNRTREHKPTSRSRPTLPPHRSLDTAIHAQPVDSPATARQWHPEQPFRRRSSCVMARSQGDGRTRGTVCSGMFRRR
jgi:Beta-lactamase